MVLAVLALAGAALAGAARCQCRQFVSGRPCDVQPFDIVPGPHATPGALFDLILCGPSVSRVLDRKEAPTLAVLTFRGEKNNCNEMTEIAIGQDNNASPTIRD